MSQRLPTYFISHGGSWVQDHPAFVRYIGVDYSGAATPTANLTGLRVYLADSDASPVEVPPPQSSRTTSRRKYGSRKDVAEWLVKRLTEDTPTLVGIDHGFSVPYALFGDGTDTLTRRTRAEASTSSRL